MIRYCMGVPEIFNSPFYPTFVYLTIINKDWGLFKQLLETRPESKLSDQIMNRFIMELAVRNGWIECVEYLIQKGFPCNSSTILMVAAKNDHLHLVRYFIEEQPKEKYQINGGILDSKWPIIEYLYENQREEFQRLQQVQDSILNNAFHGDLKLAKLLIEGGNVHLSSHSIQMAITFGYLPLLQYLLQLPQFKSFRITNDLIRKAYLGGHSEVLNELMNRAGKGTVLADYLVKGEYEIVIAGGNNWQIIINSPMSSWKRFSPFIPYHDRTWNELIHYENIKEHFHPSFERDIRSAIKNSDLLLLEYYSTIGALKLNDIHTWDLFIKSESPKIKQFFIDGLFNHFQISQVEAIHRGPFLEDCSKLGLYQTLTYLLRSKTILVGFPDRVHYKFLAPIFECDPFEFDPYTIRCLLTSLPNYIIAFFQSIPKSRYSPITTLGSSWDFYDRERAIEDIYLNVKERLESAANGDRNTHRFLIAAGSPGIGKTRLLIEFASRVHQKIGQRYPNISPRFVSIYTSFGVGTPFNHHSETDIATSLSLRMLSNFFSVSWGVVKSNWDFNNKIGLGNTLSLIRSHLIQNNEISSNSTVIIYLGVDEFQFLLTDENEPTKKRSVIKNLILEIATFLINPYSGVFLVPIFAGTLYSPLKEIFSSSGYPFISLPLPLLSISSTREILTSVPELTSLDLNDHLLKFSLLQIGGWPRPLEMFIQILLRVITDNPQQINYDNILNQTTSQLYSRYTYINTEIVQKLIALSITMSPVKNQDWQKPSLILANTSFEEYEMGGYITKKEISGDSYIIIIPLIFIDWNSTWISKKSFQLLKNILDNIKKDILWQGWDVLRILYCN
eukprot:gene10335-12689_t